MATRSGFIVKTEDGYKAVYCHWNGYPTYNGRMLLDHYNSGERARELVSMGSISVLAESLELPDGHSFDNPVKGFTVFYGRDRGEKNVETEVHRTLTDAVQSLKKQGVEFIYLWDGNQWEVSQVVEWFPLQLVTGRKESAQ